MTANTEIISEPTTVLDDLKDSLLPFAADPAVQDALRRLTSAVERAEADFATQTSTAARLVSSVRESFILGIRPSESYGAARAELFAHATDVREADAIPGIYPYPANLLTFADDSQAFIPSDDSKGVALPFTLKKRCIFIPGDLLGNRIPRVYASKNELTAHTNPVILKYEIQSRSAGTKRTYLAQWKQWVGFAIERNTEILPAGPSDFAQWLTDRAGEGRSFSTISLALQVVKAIHLYYDQPHPCNDLVLKTFSGIRRRLGVAQTQVSGLDSGSHQRLSRATACTPRRTRGGKIERVAYRTKKRSHRHRHSQELHLTPCSESKSCLRSFGGISLSDPDDGSGQLYIAIVKDRPSRRRGSMSYISSETACQHLSGSRGPPDKMTEFSPSPDKTTAPSHRVSGGGGGIRRSVQRPLRQSRHGANPCGGRLPTARYPDRWPVESQANARSLYALSDTEAGSSRSTGQTIHGGYEVTHQGVRGKSSVRLPERSTGRTGPRNSAIRLCPRILSISSNT